MTVSILMRRAYKSMANALTPSEQLQRGWERKNRLLRLAGIQIAHEGVAISAGFMCLDGNEQNIQIQRYAAIGHNFHIWNFGPVNIGQFCMIAADVTVSNGWHDKVSFAPASGILHIGSGSWIGVRATIVGSVHIGENSIVAAGALVNRDVPANCIVAGVPAKIIGVRELPEKVWHFGNLYYCPRSFNLVKADTGR